MTVLPRILPARSSTLVPWPSRVPPYLSSTYREEPLSRPAVPLPGTYTDDRRNRAAMIASTLAADKAAAVPAAILLDDDDDDDDDEVEEKKESEKEGKTVVDEEEGFREPHHVPPPPAPPPPPPPPPPYPPPARSDLAACPDNQKKEEEEKEEQEEEDEKETKTNNNEEKEEEAHICRICHDVGEPDDPLFAPCDCSGSVAFVHRHCLAQWLHHRPRRDTALPLGIGGAPRCDLCLAPFRGLRVPSFCGYLAHHARTLPWWRPSVWAEAAAGHAIMVFNDGDGDDSDGDGDGGGGNGGGGQAGVAAQVGGHHHHQQQQQQQQQQLAEDMIMMDNDDEEDVGLAGQFGLGSSTTARIYCVLTRILVKAALFFVAVGQGRVTVAAMWHLTRIGWLLECSVDRYLLPGWLLDYILSAAPELGSCDGGALGHLVAYGERVRSTILSSISSWSRSSWSLSSWSLSSWSADGAASGVMNLRLDPTWARGSLSHALATSGFTITFGLDDMIAGLVFMALWRHVIQMIRWRSSSWRKLRICAMRVLELPLQDIEELLWLCVPNIGWMMHAGLMVLPVSAFLATKLVWAVFGARDELAPLVDPLSGAGIAFQCISLLAVWWVATGICYMSQRASTHWSLWRTTHLELA